MRVLALDTTTRAGSVALIEGDRIVEQRPGDGARAQVERLPHELIGVLDAHQMTLSDVDLFAVAAGPGSFTGLRIGIATVQGLAFVHGKRIAGVSALDAAAHVAAADAAAGSMIAVFLDAHRDEVFAALYEVTSSPPYDPARLTTVDEATVGTPVGTLERWRDTLRPGATFVGSGAVKYGDAIARVVTEMQNRGNPLLAGAIGRIAVAQARAGTTVGPAGIQPLYVRRPDVEIARDRAK